MSRTQRSWLFLAIGVASLVFFVVTAYEIVAPQFQKGAAGAGPVTLRGWFELAASALAAIGFGGGGIVQSAVTFLEARLPSVIHQAAPSVSVTEAQEFVEFAEIGGYMRLIQTTSDQAAKGKLIEAVRIRIDNLRDKVAPPPVPTVQVPTVANAS